MSATYRLTVTHGVSAITCLLCDRVSELPGDVEHRYCSRCHLFHEHVTEGRRLLAEGGSHACEEWCTFRDRCALCGRDLHPRERTETRAGKYYARDERDRLREIPLSALPPHPVPDVVICRRLADFSHGRTPRGGSTRACARCGALIAWNPRGPHPDRVHICMQCAGIEPLPFPPGEEPA